MFLGVFSNPLGEMFSSNTVKTEPFQSGLVQRMGRVFYCKGKRCTEILMFGVLKRDSVQFLRKGLEEKIIRAIAWATLE